MAEQKRAGGCNAANSQKTALTRPLSVCQYRARAKSVRRLHPELHLTLFPQGLTVTEGSFTQTPRLRKTIIKGQENGLMKKLKNEQNSLTLIPVIVLMVLVTSASSLPAEPAQTYHGRLTSGTFY